MNAHNTNLLTCEALEKHIAALLGQYPNDLKRVHEILEETYVVVRGGVYEIGIKIGNTTFYDSRL